MECIWSINMIVINVIDPLHQRNVSNLAKEAY